jgi:hypothetical protein
LNGLTINKLAVAGETFNSTSCFEIFSNAFIKPSGFLVNKTLPASAKNSLFLEIASCIN